MIFSTIILVYLLIATIMDLLWRKIKNQWILYGIVMGLCFSYLDCGIWGSGGCRLDIGFPGLILSLTGFLIPVPLLVIYRLKLIGAGDIKLLMVTGIFLGAKALLKCIPLIIFSGGFVGILILIINKKTILKKLHKMPFAPAVLIGVSLWLFKEDLWINIF